MLNPKWLTLAALLLAGCSTVTIDSPQSLPAMLGYNVTEEDQNGDGRVDYILFRHPQRADTDVGFQDTDFDGFFDKKIKYGFAVTKEDIRIRAK